MLAQFGAAQESRVTADVYRSADRRRNATPGRNSAIDAESMRNYERNAALQQNVETTVI